MQKLESQKRSLPSRARYKNGSGSHMVGAQNILDRTRELIGYPDLESIQEGVTFAAAKLAAPTAKLIRKYPLAAVGSAIALGFLSAVYFRRPSEK